MMKRAKTDKVDSALIAQFVANHQEGLTPWHPKSDTLASLQNLQSCLTDLKEDRQRVLGRIEACTHTNRSGRSKAFESYQEQLNFLDQQIQKVHSLILSLVESEEGLRKQYEALLSVEGIGSATALGLLALLPDLSHFSHAKQLTAFAGLNPAVKQSGSSVRGKGSLSKQGNAALRKLLYMPALSAKRHNKVLSVFAKGLEDRGKPAKVIIVAVMRKLLHYIFSLLKKGGTSPELAS
jgi:transposase